MDPYRGLWTGRPKTQGSEYDLQIGLTDGVVGERIGTFYIPSGTSCGGISRIASVGGTLVYDETLMFGTVNYCLGASTATITPLTADTLDYDWKEPNSPKHHRGIMTRRARAGTGSVASFRGLWMGTIIQTNPTFTRIVALALDDGTLGDPVAHLIYTGAGNECGGQLVLQTATTSELNLTELLASVGKGCPIDGSIRLRTMGNQVEFAWTSTSASTSAVGLLARMR